MKRRWPAAARDLALVAAIIFAGSCLIVAADSLDRLRADVAAQALACRAAGEAAADIQRGK